VKSSKSSKHKSAVNAAYASASVVNPEELELGKERFDHRDDFDIVLRVLTRDDIQGSGEATQKI
jgi:hypothetical protein